MTIQSFKDLTVWQKSTELVIEIYSLTKDLPPTEQFGLTNQMRRPAISIPSNIAEGKKRGTVKDFVHFLYIADGSAAELESQVLISEKLYPRIKSTKAKELLLEVQKMLTVMIKKLKANSYNL